MKKISILLPYKENFSSKYAGAVSLLLFQIADDLIDFRGEKKLAGKEIRKDLTKGKATLISLLGYKNTIKYAKKLKLNIIKKIKIYGNKSSDLKDTIEFILNRNR